MRCPLHLLTLLTLVDVGLSAIGKSELPVEDETTYGLDISFPIHHQVSTNYDFLPHNVDPSLPAPISKKDMPIQRLGDRQNMYMRHLNACRNHHSSEGNSHLCDSFEYDRLLMNRRQPQSMVNMTATGFQKVRAPEHLTKLVEDFWQTNHLLQTEENWGTGNSYVNYWDIPTRLVSVDDAGLRGSGFKLKKEIWAALSAVMEEWTQEELQPSSLYGVRVYGEGAIMMPQYVDFCAR